MKIGLCGTMSCGKSTLVKELARLPQFEGYYIATERSKYLRDQGIQLNTDSTLKGQLVFAAERSLELMKDNLITDRSVYDICSFSLSSKLMLDKQKEWFVNLIMELRDEYDVIFYVSPDGIPIENNGVREIDPIYREKINAVILELLVEYPPKKLVEVKGTVSERINIVLSNLT